MTSFVLLMSFVYWTNPALSCDQFLNSLEEMCSELLEVTDLVTYILCHGGAGILISCASLQPCARLPAVSSPS